MTAALKPVDFAAAAIFAAATGFAASTVLGGPAAILAAPGAFALVLGGLGRVGAEHRLPHFELAPLDAPRDAPRDAGDERVVRLFDPREMARTLAVASDRVPPDAGQALSDALAQLKRSLR